MLMSKTICNTEPRLERSSLTEVNATDHAEITSHRMATISQNLESEKVIHNSVQLLSSTINLDLHKSS